MDKQILNEFANQCAKLFEHKTREDGTSFYSLKDREKNTNLDEMIRNVHKVYFGTIFPNDWIYEQIYLSFYKYDEFDDAADFIDSAHTATDVYTSDLLKWASEYFSDYLDHATCSHQHKYFTDIIREAQERAITDIRHAVVGFIHGNFDYYEDY